jgi:acyl-CoA reductase-like NAD-dependent aldehyde dehydrogenase
LKQRLGLLNLSGTHRFLSKQIFYLKVAQIINERKEEAAKIIAMEAAKPIKVARNEID